MSKVLRRISKALVIMAATTLFTSIPAFASQEGWIQNSNGTWSYNHNGNIYKHTWLQINGQKWYHFDDNGIMSTGWTKDGSGNWYYLNLDGSMASNTVIDGYQLNASGQWVDNNWNPVNGDQGKGNVNTAPGNGTLVINYDGVQVFKNNTVIEIWVCDSEGNWNKGKSVTTVPAKENGKNDDLENGAARSLSYTDYTYTTLQLAPAGHEYIIATKWKPRYRGVTIEFYKDNFYSSSNNKEKELLFAKNI